MAGSVTNQTGLTGLVDAITRHEGAIFQWQHYSLLSDKGLDSGGRDLCARFGPNRTVPGEKWLNLIIIGSRDPMDMADCPLPTIDPAIGYFELPIRPDGDQTKTYQGQNLYVGRGNYIVHNNRCAQSVQAITGGWVRFTQLDAAQTAGHYEVTGAFGTFTGDFIAPTCTFTGTRPSKVTCAA